MGRKSWTAIVTGAQQMAPKKKEAPVEEVNVVNNGPYWFRVRYGDNQTTLFNMDCWGIVLVHHMKEVCGFAEIPETIDLQRDDSSLVGLSDIGTQSAKDKLKPKATYTLCKLIPPEVEGGAVVPELLYTAPEIQVES